MLFRCRKTRRSFSMAYQSICAVFLVFAYISKLCVGQFSIPEVKLEAFTPKGLRISIPALDKIELFAFHGKLNKPITQIEPGEFSEDVTRSTNGRFTYTNPSIKLKEGDVINYWVFIQHDQFGYRKDEQSWTVDQLQPQSDLNKSPENTCSSTITKVLGKNSVCSGENIINYKFTESTLDSKTWLIEQYIANGPDWEYVIYKNEPDVIGVENNVLRIRPKVVEENTMTNLDIEGCTRPKGTQECIKNFEGLYQAPIVSGRIVSKDAFCFGTITIKAKLPQGDWLYPEIFLEDVNDPRRRILLAYARGNRALTGKDGDDIGGKLLFGGPYTSPQEPTRSKYLSSHLNPKHVGQDWHIFSVKWAKDQMDLYIDNQNYGLINAETLRATGFNRETMVRLVLGVGAGGPNDFPDGYTSGSFPKPWRSFKRTAVKDFLSGKDQWLQTWVGDNQLQVEYVIIKAL